MKIFANSIKYSISRLKIPGIAETTTHMRTKLTRGVNLEGVQRDEQQQEQHLGFVVEGLGTCTEP